MRTPWLASLALLSPLALGGCPPAPAEGEGEEGEGEEGEGEEGEGEEGEGEGEGEALLRLYDVVGAIDVAPDGAHAALYDLGTGDIVAVDVATGVDTVVENVGDPLRDLPTGMANTGAVSAIYDTPTQAGLFVPGAGWTTFASPFREGCGLDAADATAGDIAGAFDVDAAGTAVVGLAWDGCRVAAIVADGEGTEVLPPLGEPQGGAPRAAHNRATVISDDGAVFAGFAEGAVADRRPAFWTRTTGTLIASPLFTDDAPGEVLTINADGSVMAGIWNNAGFVFSVGGDVIDLGRTADALPNEPVFPNAITGDGAVIFGQLGDAFTGLPRAFVWTEARGMRTIADVLGGALELEGGTVLASVAGVDTAGGVLAGTVLTGDGATKAYVLVVDPAVWTR